MASPCIILENVPGLIERENLTYAELRHFLSDVAGCEHLHSSPLQAAVFSLILLASPTSADHFTVFEVHAGVFDCATNRRRVILVGFSDHTHLAKFGNGPKPWTEKPRPIKGIVRCPRFSSYRPLTSLTSLTSLPLPSSSPPLFIDSPCLQQPYFLSGTVGCEARGAPRRQ